MYGLAYELATGTTNQTKDGSVVRKCRVADRTASIVFSLWNEQADAVEEGDILRLTKGLTIQCFICTNTYIDVCVYGFSRGQGWSTSKVLINYFDHIKGLSNFFDHIKEHLTALWVHSMPASCIITYIIMVCCSDNNCASLYSYASLWKGGMVLYSGKYGILEKIGE